MLFLVLWVGGCGVENPEEVFAPARMLYVQAEAHENEGLYSEAIIKYEKITTHFPGTRLGSHAYLKLAELYFNQNDWDKAETNYRVFLSENGESHLTPYVLYRLLRVHHENTLTGLIFKAREVDRDMSPHRNIILEYQRFFLLYPQSRYLKEIKPFYRTARQYLAEYERLVGDFYFERELYNAAIGRYRYQLRHFPDYPQSQAVFKRLIAAYRRNQQPHIALELQTLYEADGSPENPEPTTRR